MKSRDGWAAAASYTIADLMMLHSKLIIGYLVAGILTVAVAASVYGVVFF